MLDKELTEIVGKFENQIEYSFKNKDLLVHALSHKSYTNERGLAKDASNERLEFLGDAILEFVVSEYLYNAMPDESEGTMTRLRAAVVCEQSLADVANSMNYGDYMLLGKGEESTGGRGRASLVSDMFEAVVAAMYLDSDIETVKAWILKRFKRSIGQASEGKAIKDYKTMLQEAVQKGDKGRVSYRVLDENGPDHAKMFLIEVLVDDIALASGKGTSKKDAEQNAACIALENMRKNL